MNNFDLVLPLLTEVWNTTTDPVSFHVQILQRSKDGHDKATKLVAEWFIGSEQRFNFLIPAMANLCNAYNARCYINLNPKSDESVLWKMLRNSAERLETKSYSPYSMLSSAHDSCNGHGFKRWVIDIDDPFVEVEPLVEQINLCRSATPNKNVICQIPTKNGVHLITNPFNLSQIQFPSGIEVKKNNSTLLYYGID